MKQTLTTLVYFITILLLNQTSLAQQIQDQSLQFQKRVEANALVNSVVMDQERGTPRMIQLTQEAKSTKVLEEAPDLINEVLELRPSQDRLKFKKSSKYRDLVEVQRYQQYYKEVKVEHGQYLVTAIDQQIHALSGEFYKLDNLSTSPTLTEAEALQAALSFVDADEYAWETILSMNTFTIEPMVKVALNEYYEDYLPKGELVIVDNYYTPEVDMDLAYKFNIYASYPLSRAYIYINAHTGEVMLQDAIIKHANGDTRYSGNRDFGSEVGTSGQFELLNTAKGGGIETRDLQGAGGLPISVGAVYELSEAFTDNDGMWTAAEHTENPFTNEVNNDDIALDAHWGAEIVYDYWFNQHGRLSFDDNNAKIFSFVHYGVNYDNAFWNGSYMTYGDGSYQQGQNPAGDFAPLTSMDVCAHEIGHAICTHTSDLVYARESGAMNEGFSDIWAAAVENYVLTQVDGSLEYDPWGIGEQIDERDGGIGPGTAASRALRWMDDPKAAGDPDTYGGDNWQEPECGEPTLANDQCGVHTNSGVLNKWFYFMVEGSGQNFSPGSGKALSDDGINDEGNPYNFSGLGFTKAEKIAFLTETLLFPNAKFLDARYASELAAGILYGPCSNEQNATLAAWDAVNVTGNSPDCTPRVDFVYSSGTENEESGSGGCNASKIIEIDIYSIGINSTVSIMATGSGANPATSGLDFDLLTTSVDFSTENVQTVQLEIYDDAYVETDEEITLSISGFPGNEHVLTVSDNDVVPTIGDGTEDVLALETFSSATHPAGWSTLTINGEGGNDWKFNGSGTAAGKAYIAFPGTTIPSYNQTADASVILRSPYLDARGKKNLQVTFDWEAGGEVDAVDATLYDYGSFGYSLNGSDFTYLEDFVGAAGGAAPQSGFYNATLPAELDNKQFYLGWRWYNDALVGTAFSFLIDNVEVSGDIVPIATAANSSDAAIVDDNNEAYFYNINGEIIAKVKSLGGDFGCVEVKIEEAGTGQQSFEFGDRAQKVFRVTSSNQTDQYEVTFYFTAAELASFGPDATLLNLIKVEGIDIDAADPGNSVIVENDNLSASEINAGGDISYTATFTGFSVFGVYLPTLVLPVDLLSFDAKHEPSQIVLNWHTVSETNNKGFEVMRRAENENRFYQIGWVDGYGTTDTDKFYDFIDRDVVPATTYYYQLNQIDLAGKETLSDIVAVTTDGAQGTVNIYPNPASDQIFVNALGNNFKRNSQIEVFNVNGVLVKSTVNPTDGNTARIDLGGLPSGIYLVRTYLEGEVYTQRIIKEKQ